MKIRDLFWVVSILFSILLVPNRVSAQIDADRSIVLGKNALQFKDYLLSIRYFSSAIKSSPYLAEPYFYRAFAKYNLDDYRGAEADCDSCLRRNKFIYDAYYLRGITRHAMGKDSLALADYEVVLKDNPDSQGVLHNSSLIYLNQKKYSQFEKAIERLQRFYPKYAPGFIIESSYALQKKDTLKAIGLINHAKQLDALSSTPYRALASIYYEKGDFSQALKQLNTGIRLDESNLDLHILRGVVHYSMHNLSAALDDYSRAIELEPNNLVARFNRGLLRIRVGDFNNAVNDFNVVLQLSPDNYLARYNRALLLQNLGEGPEAIVDLNIILDRYPTFVPAYLSRAEVLKGVGNESAAKRDMLRVASLVQKKHENRSNSSAEDTSIRDEETATEGVREETDRNINKFRMLVHNSSVKNFAGLYNEDVRGRLQDRDVSFDAEPPLHLSYYEFETKDLLPLRINDKEIFTALNTSMLSDQLKLVLYVPVLSQSMVSDHINEIDSLNAVEAKSETDYVRLAIAYQSVKDFEKAVEEWSHAISYRPNVVYYLQRSVSYYYLYLSKRLEQQRSTIKRDDVAINELNTRRGIVSQATQTEAKIAKTMGTLELRNALEDVKVVVKSLTNSVTANYNLGTYLYLLGKYPEAIEAFEKVISIDDSIGAAYFNLGLSYYALGDVVNAEINMSRAGALGLPRAYAIMKKMQ